MKARSVRTLSVLACAGLLVGAFAAGPADAAKKKKKPPVVVPTCAEFSPPEGAATEVVKVTDAATAEAPIAVEVETGPGVGSGHDGAPSITQVPIQVDTAAAGSGLYTTVHFTPAWDYDLYILDEGGTEIAHSAGFLASGPLAVSGAAGESAIGSENIYGLDSADCTNYIVEIVGATTPGETVTVDLYLGEVQAP